MVKLSPGSFCFVFEMFQPLLGLPGLGQQLLIHVSHSSQLLHTGDLGKLVVPPMVLP
jgi:hypothetical protein